jgi:talin
MIDVNKQNVTSHLSAMNAATAQVVTLTSNGAQNSDFNAVGAAVSSISTNLGDFSKDVMMIAALQDDKIAESDRLLDAAKKLCSAFTDFLRHVEPDCNEPRQNMFSAVGKIGEVGNEIIRNINREENLDETFRMQETFIGLAKLVASATAGLVIASKNVANHCGNQQGVNEVISLVTQCALSTSQLVSCTKVCSSTISSRECQEQIVEAARQVSRQVDGVMDVANMHCQNEQALSELTQCAQNVTSSVMQLLDNVKASDEQIINIRSSNCSALNKQDESIERIFNATDMLFNSVGNGPEMIRQAKIVAQSTTELINSLKQEAHVQPTSEQQRKLLLAAKLLAEATSKIVEAAKGCASNPSDERMQSSLKKAAEDLKNATTVAAGDNLQLKLIKRLELCAKQAASCATQSIAAIQV